SCRDMPIPLLFPYTTLFRSYGRVFTFRQFYSGPVINLALPYSDDIKESTPLSNILNFMFNGHIHRFHIHTKIFYAFNSGTFRLFPLYEKWKQDFIMHYI